MSDHEQHAWASLVAAALVWAFFTMRMTEGGWPRIDLGSLPPLVFAPLSALFAGHIVKQAAIIWQYRA